jgi:hypothetical protein
VTKLSEQEFEALIKTSRYVEIRDCSESIHFNYGGGEIKEMTEYCGLSITQFM